MSRHSKNSNTRQYFTYAERKKTKYGTQKKRLTGDSLRKVDTCCLCLHSAVNPMITPYGYMYCKECILSNIIAQKKQINRERKLKEEELKMKQLEEQMKKQEDGMKKAEQLEQTLYGLPSKTEEQTQEENKDTCFWIPSKTPTVDKPDKKETKSQIVDPECNKPIKVKQLIPVYFASIENTEGKKLEEGEKYMCPCCLKAFTNILKGYALKGCGHIFCSNCTDTIIKKEKVCPTCSKKVRKDSHIIKIASAQGTGFAKSSGKHAIAEHYTPALGFA